MAEFRFTVQGESCSVSVDEEEHRHPSSLGRSAEEQILALLNQKSIELHPDEKRFLPSKIYVAITPYSLSRGFIDLGILASEEQRGNVYQLINIPTGSFIKRSYRPEQSIGAIAADIRQLQKNLGLNDHVVLSEVVDGQPHELTATMLVRDLRSRDIHWTVERSR